MDLTRREMITAGLGALALAGVTEVSGTTSQPGVAWSDRTPIGQIVLATWESSSSTNPRGWFNEPSSDFTSTTGRANFKSRLLDTADYIVSECARVGSKSAVFWNMEGCQYPHGTGTYIGDPRLTEVLAPEMANGAINQFMGKLTASLPNVGICLRPQQFSLDTLEQQFLETKDATQNLVNKVLYARNHWGANVNTFYVDSSVEENYVGSGPNLVHNVPDSIWQNLHRIYPTCLFIPENENPNTSLYAAPYGELDQGWFGPTQFGNPGWGCIYVPNGPMTNGVFNDHAKLVTSVKQGNRLFFRAWFEDNPTTQEVIQIYKDAGA